jgi:primosomal protein N' (replication factor Y) (superfamily II helicase)
MQATQPIQYMEQRQGELFDTQAPPWEIDAQQDAIVANIAFADPPFGPFHYTIPTEFIGKLTAGMRVRVPLGKSNRLVLGYCIGVESIQQMPGTLKPLSEVIDDQSLCPGKLVELTRWMSAYYLAPVGQVFQAVIPAGVRAAAGTRMKKFVNLVEANADESMFESLPLKQRLVMRQMIHAAGRLALDDLLHLVDCSLSPIQKLVKAQHLRIDEERVMQVDASRSTIPRSEARALSVDQRVAFQAIDAAIESLQHQTILLHGITGSGKTEVYMQAIERVLILGRQAIVLVPEISLTPQTRHHFTARFGDVALLHSHMTDAERHFQWRRIFDGEVSVIVGPRSAVFAPAPRLGLIIIDEEHESSFKQETLPRYHARDVALHRASLERIPLVLGSATPSLETWHRAVHQVYKRVSMPRRIHNRLLPNVQIVDLRSNRSKPFNSSISDALRQEINNTIDQQGQTILLLNRRGYSTNIQCPACGSVVHCPDCDIPLTHHRDGGKAMCHYCDYTIPTPPVCPKCSFDGIRFSGTGTQRLEDELKSMFPHASIARMDSDTMRRPGSHERTLTAFREGQIQILLGTQMIAKGLDFPNVLLVGVINADTALHFPDFRATERTFQLVTQVAGRTGRGDKPGKVIVQTFSPDHPSIQLASQHDYLTFAAAELAHREKFAYPPYGYLSRIIVRGPKEDQASDFAASIGKTLHRHRELIQKSIRILGPSVPSIARLRGLYRFHVMISSDDAAAMNRLLVRTIADLNPPKEIQYVVDVDPIDMM